MLVIPEILGKPLFLGMLCMVYIENSTLTYIKHTRLAYDFYIWDSMILLGLLFIPYLIE